MDFTTSSTGNQREVSFFKSNQKSEEIIVISPTTNPSTEAIAEGLVESLRVFDSCVVAFSGGVDSSVVASAAWRALGTRSVALTSVGSAVSQEDLRYASLVASNIGIEHKQIDTHEIDDPNYLRNDSKRCYYCKSHLYTALESWRVQHGFQKILSGTNADDLADYRPGLVAASEHAVFAPLAELKIGKKSVRAIAAYWNLPVADRPASPCLASRIAYGEHVSRERLDRIEHAEAWLRGQGFQDVRVRLHGDELARVEVDRSDIMRLINDNIRDVIDAQLKSLGFRFVTIDLGGRQSGSLNRSLHPSLPILH